jgi:hypothetical protein
MTGAFVGAYYLISETSYAIAQKPHYFQPYECGFNQLGGVLFAGFTFLIWIFLMFELEIIMLMVTPTYDTSMPLFLMVLFFTYSWVWVYPVTNNI